MDNEYLDGLTYEELDELRFEVINADPTSPFISDISAAINRLQFPAKDTEYRSIVPVREPVVTRVLRLIGVGG